MRLKILSAVTELGMPFFYVPVMVIAIILNRELGIKMVIALLLIELAGGMIKIAYPRRRPVPMPNKTLAQRWNAGSFPSIHAARVTSVVLFIYSLFNSLALLALGLPVILAVGYSRIYLKKHYPSDVVAGAVMGAIISWIALRV